MEAATPLPFSTATVRVLGDRIAIDGLVVVDECAVRLAREHEDPTRLLTDAIEIGARVLDREQTGANAEFVKAEFEKAARELDVEFVERARSVAERLDQKVDEVFGPENGHVTKALERHFGDESSTAVQHQVRAVVSDAMARSREDLLKQFSSADGSNPLADFKAMAAAMMKQASDRQSERLEAMTARLEEMRVQMTELRAEKEKLEEVAAVEEKGTAKGRTYEDLVAEAIESIAGAQGDDSEAVGDVKEATRKTGDIVVGIDACNGPARGRIVFEAKNARLSRPEALRELERARTERNADFAVLVVAHEGKVPARMLPLREYNGDKMIVPFDPEDGSLLSLQVGYALARARVLLRRADGDGIDSEAIRSSAERAVQSLGEVQRIKQQLTASKTAVDKAAEIVDAMAGAVKANLAEIHALVAAAALAGVDARAD